MHCKVNHKVFVMKYKVNKLRPYLSNFFYKHTVFACYGRFNNICKLCTGKSVSTQYHLGLRGQGLPSNSIRSLGQAKGPRRKEAMLI